MRNVQFINLIDGNYDHYTLVDKVFIDKLLNDFNNNLITKHGFYLCINSNNTYIAIDNSGGYVFVKEYNTLEECIQYFSGQDLDGDIL